MRGLKDSLPPNEAPDFASGIFQTTGGRYYVPAVADRKQIFDARQNLALAARVAQAFAQTNARALRSSLRRAPTPGDLYIAHIFGPEAAAEFVRSVERRPEAIAAVQHPELARAAPDLFAEGTSAQVYQRLTTAVRERIPRNGPRVRVLTVRRATEEPPLQPALLSMGQNIAAVRAPANSFPVWKTDVSAPQEKPVVWTANVAPSQ